MTSVENDSNKKKLKLSSYPKVWAYGSRPISQLMDGPIIVQEKVDGSQMSFGVDSDNNLLMRSRGAVIYPETADKNFKLPATTIVELFQSGVLRIGYTYRGEAVSSVRHNVLTYLRIPLGGIILFDIEDGDENPLDINDPHWEEIGLEKVPTYFHGEMDGILGATQLQNDYILKNPPVESILGGPIEGIVIKNYTKYGEEGKYMVGKMVRHEFKERHSVQWKSSNPNNKDIVEILGNALKTEARFRNAVKRLGEKGELKQDPRDIGPLLAELVEDTKIEETDYIKDVLFDHFWPQLKRKVTTGFPEWYKSYLIDSTSNSFITPNNRDNV